ncbi:6-bladed beta-propeller [Chitinophaga sp. 30R24]|uniref:6-bladed beta-propeller n=1 Tax=Chitinophaga sp. 30R24 TaxID=3248838 RepID=UPI003B8FD954
MKLLLLPTSLIVIFFSSCNYVTLLKEGKEQTTVISIPNQLEELSLCKYSEIFDSIRIVKLETNNKSMIGRIDKMIAFDHKFFILDQVERKAVIEFDENGKFLRIIGSKGSGKGQYNEPNDISINNNKLIVWVNDFRKFLVYDMNGNFLKEVRVKSYAKSGVILDHEQFALFMDIGGDKVTNEKFDLKIFDKNGELTHIGFEKKDRNFSKGIFFFSQNDGQTIVSPGYSNTIYSLTSDLLTKKYKIDFGSREIPYDTIRNFTSISKFLSWAKKSNWAYLSKYFETPDFLIFNFNYKGSTYTCFYSKKSKVLKYGNVWFNNINGIFPGILISVQGNNAISYYDPSTIDTYKKSHQSHTTNFQADTLATGANKYFKELLGKSIGFQASDFLYTKEQIDLLHSIQPSDNPVLLIQKLKEL